MQTVLPLLEVLSPLPHALHDVWLESLAIVFSLHSLHSTAALVADARPGGHGMQATDPGALAYDPGSQATRPFPSPSHLYPASHCTVMFNKALMYEPGGTGAQLVEPRPVFPYPLGHVLQVVFPSNAWNRPSPHSTHVVEAVAASALENRPGLHALHPDTF